MSHSGIEAQGINGKIKYRESLVILFQEEFFPITRRGRKGVEFRKFLYVKNLKICCS